jgi:hypothetical protein
MGAIFVTADSKGDGAEWSKSVMDELRPKLKEFAKRETDEGGLKPGGTVSGSEYSPARGRKRS